MAKTMLSLTRMRGRNGVDPPILLPEGSCQAASNVEMTALGVCQKRYGSSAFTTTFASGGPFTWPMKSLFRHVPAADEGAAELWAIDGASTPQLCRCVVTTYWTEYAVGDAINAANAYYANACTFNGKMFLAYDSAVDRLHVWDGTSLRRVGLGTPAAAPTVADTGSGSYAATLRYYKVTWAVVSGVTLRRSEASAASTAFTPSGSGTAARVTRPTAAGEGETHWEVWGSTDGTTYTFLSYVLIADTTYDDSADPAAYGTTAIPLVGANTAPTSVKFIVTNGNRLLMAGSWETGGKNNRVWFTPVLGASDVGDDERIPNTTTNKNWIDLDENDGGYITGMVGEFQGGTLVFKYRQIWKLTPTGNDTTPYRATKISSIVGAVSQKSIVEAEDENGNPAVYFLSARGPYRYGSAGLEYVGYEVADLWATAMSSGGLFATQVSAHGVYYSSRRQVWWFFRSRTSELALDYNMVLNVNNIQRTEDGCRGGWVLYAFPGQYKTASVMHSNILGSTTSTQLVPYVAIWTSASIEKTLVCDDSSATTDAGTTFRGYLTTKAYAPGAIGRNISTMEPQVVGTGGNGTVTISTTGSLGDTSSGAVNFNSTTMVLRQADATQSNQDGYVALTIGDASAQALNWNIHAVVVPYKVQEER